MFGIDQLKDEIAKLEVKLDRRITAKLATKGARFLLLIAQDSQDDPDKLSTIKNALQALGE